MDIIKYDMTDIWAVAGDVVAPDSVKVRAGWGVEVVPRQWWNWFENRQDNNIAYMLQKGFPEWDATTEYIINKSYVQRNGIVYRATATSTNSDPIALTSWVKAFVESAPYLELLKALSVSNNTMPYIDGTGVAQNTATTAYGRSVLNVADAAAARTLFAAQVSHANLTGLSSVSGSANNLPYFTGSGNMAVTTFTGFARSLLDDADAAAMRATLGVYSTTESDTALTNGLNTRQPLDATLTALAGLATGANQLAYSTGTDTFAQTPLTVFARSILDDADAVTVRGTIGADDAANLTTGLLALARLPATLTGKNASTATALETARTIQGVSFNGTANITLSVVDKDSATGSAALPAGTSAQRTASPANGMLRYNSETNEFEGYQNGAWAGIGGGTPLYTVLWWPNRASIPAGYIPADGQLLTRTTYQAAFAGVNSGILPVVSDATWLATSTSRGCYTTGDGSTTFRIPDLNGKTAGTTAAPFLRGDGTNSTGIAGNFQASANLSHTHTFQSGAGAIKNTYPTVSLGFTGTGYADAGSPAVLLASGDVESRPVNVTGVFVIKLIGGASELSQDDASVAVAALEDKLQFVSGRNRIINGDARVSQKVTVTASAGVNAYGGVDRFRATNAASAGGSFTQSRTTMTVDGIAKLAVRHQVVTAIANTTGSNYWGGINQLIEGLNCYDFVGKPMVASFIFNTNVSGTYSVSLADSGGAKSHVSTFVAVANTPRRVELTTIVPTDAVLPNTTAASLQIRIGATNTGTYQTSSLNGWQSGNFISATGATNWAGTAGNFIEVTDLQIELGTQATEFERLDITDQINQCRRYYTVVSQSQQYYAQLASMPWINSCALPVAMRVTPTVSLLAAGSITNVSTGNVSVINNIAYTLEMVNSAVGTVALVGRLYSLDAEL
jgi:hypothetical protein